MAQPYDLTIAQIKTGIASGELSPVELVQSLLDRAGAVDSKVQAWETLDAEGALAAAHTAEAQLRHFPGRALESVPVGIKDIFYTAGLRTAASFAPFAGLIPDYDAEAVARLRSAGSIILGKTVTTQFAFSDPPKTRNPWNQDRTPGGSSSGSGAAVAARLVPAALGSQTAGSVLRPAAYCGVVGFKPTFGRISRHGVLPLSWSLDHVGIIVRTVEDAGLVYQAIAGADARDPASLRLPVSDVVAALQHLPAPPRLGLVVDFVERAEPEVRAHLEAVASRWERAGVEVRRVQLPFPMDTVLATHQVVMQSEAAAVHSANLAAHASDYRPLLRAYVENGHLIPAAAYVQAQRLRRRIREGVESMLDGLDAFLTPTASNVAPAPATTGDRSFQAVWTMLGAPAIALPSGFDSFGMPFSVQLAGRHLDEEGLLATARWCEAHLDPMPAPPL